MVQGNKKPRSGVSRREFIKKSGIAFGATLGYYVRIDTAG